MSRKPKPHVCAPHLLPGECIECAPNTPASAPVQTCPDCRKPTKGEPGEHCIIRGGDRCIRTERDSLRQDLATLQAKHDAMVELHALALERGQHPTLDNQVRLDEMRHAMALASRAKGGA